MLHSPVPSALLKLDASEFISAWAFAPRFTGILGSDSDMAIQQQVFGRHSQGIPDVQAGGGINLVRNAQGFVVTTTAVVDDASSVLANRDLSMHPQANPLPAQWPLVKQSVEASETLEIPSGWGTIIPSSLTISGIVLNSGTRMVI